MVLLSSIVTPRSICTKRMGTLWAGATGALAAENDDMVHILKPCLPVEGGFPGRMVAMSTHDGCLGSFQCMASILAKCRFCPKQSVSRSDTSTTSSNHPMLALIYTSPKASVLDGQIRQNKDVVSGRFLYIATYGTCPIIMRRVVHTFDLSGSLKHCACVHK